MIISLDSPIFYISNMDKSIDFYTKYLNFSILERSDSFSVLIAGDAKISLNLADGRDKVAGNQVVIFVLDDIEKDFDRISKLDVAMECPLKDAGYGKTFIVKDLDGNKLEFIES